MVDLLTFLVYYIINDTKYNYHKQEVIQYGKH